MVRYLVVAAETAHSEELVEHLSERSRTDVEAEFVLLVPATPVAHLLISDETESTERARRRAASAANALRQQGLRIIETRFGGPSPLLAVEDELRRQPEYDEVIVSTFSPGMSRGLRLDAISRLRGRVRLPVSHVVALRAPAGGVSRPFGLVRAVHRCSRGRVLTPPAFGPVARRDCG